MSAAASPANPSPTLPAPTPSRRQVWRRIDARLSAGIGWLALAVVLVALLALLGLRAWAWPRIDQWREPIARSLGERIGAELRIARLVPETGSWLPELTLEGLALVDDGQPLLEVPRLRMRLSASTLWTLEPRFELLQLESPRLRIERTGPQRLRVAGIDIDLQRPGDGRLLERVFGQRRVRVTGAVVDWIDTLAGRRASIGPIEASLGSVGRRHQFSVGLPTVAGAWQGLELAGAFYRAPRRAAADWRTWTGEVYLGLEAAELASLGALTAAPSALLPARGLLDLKAWLRFDAGGERTLDFRLAAADLDWRSAGPEPLRRVDIALEGRGTERAGRLDLLLDAARLRVPQGVDLASAGPLRASLDAEGRLQRLEGAWRAFDAGEALAFARRLPLPAALGGVLARASLAGRIDGLGLRWERQAQPQGVVAAWFGGSVDAHADIQDLALRVAPATPGGGGGADLPWFDRLTGRVQLDGGGLALRLASRGATLGFPGIFAEPAIAFDEFDADLRIAPAGERPAAGVVLELASARFANADGAGMVSGRWRSGGRGPGIVDLAGRLERGEGSRVWRYLPEPIAPEVRDWVRRAVVAGRADDTRFVLRGDLADFPFVQPSEGEFHVDARLSDAVLAYAEGWPPIDEVHGRLRFERNGMQVAMRSGRILGVALGPTIAAIRDYDEALLRVEGGGEGAAQQMLRFVDESPLAARIDDFAREARIDGDARLRLRLALPLREPEAARVEGTVAFAGNTLHLDEALPPFSALAGTLEFSERALVLRDLSARFLDGPLQVDGETPEPGRLLLRVRGRVGAEAMRSLVDNPLTRRLSGAADYQAELDLAGHAVSLSLDSSLVGLGVAMPAPFDKPPPAALPLRVRVAARPSAEPRSPSPGDDIRVDLGSAMHLALARERDPRDGRLRIHRGAFAIDGEPVLPDAGLALLLKAPELDLDAWLPLLADGELQDAGERVADEFAPGFSLLPSSIAAVADRLLVGGKQFNAVVIGATREEGFWRANVVSREVDGFFSWRDAAPGQPIGTLSARFNRLEIPPARTGEYEALLDASPELLPALDVVAEEFILGDRPVGTLSLKAALEGNVAAPVWRLDALELKHPAATLRASGDWAPARPGSARATRLDFDLDVADAGSLLAVYGIPQAVRGGAGRLGGSLGWQGSPLAIDYPSLAGAMRLGIGKGQFLKTDPGIAKLIGVLNLQSLPRRLALDFRDVFAEGFAFDEITGEVAVDTGVARTERFAMRGLQAQVEIRGEANLLHETQSLSVTVRPELNAGMASLAYAAMASPAIGLGSFIVQSLLRKPLQELFSYRYRISGSWADPLVEELPREPPPAAGSQPGEPIR